MNRVFGRLVGGHISTQNFIQAICMLNLLKRVIYTTGSYAAIHYHFGTVLTLRRSERQKPRKIGRLNVEKRLQDVANASN